jgi:hypothetical protein
MLKDGCEDPSVFVLCRWQPFSLEPRVLSGCLPRADPTGRLYSMGLGPDRDGMWCGTCGLL